YLDSIIVNIEAENDTPVERLLWLVSRVQVHDLRRRQPAILVIQVRLNDTVADGLGAHVLCSAWVGQVKFLRNVLQGDSRVRDVNFPQASLDHVVAETLDQCVVLVGSEHICVSLDSLVEGMQITTSNRLCQLQV